VFDTKFHATQVVQVQQAVSQDHSQSTLIVTLVPPPIPFVISLDHVAVDEVGSRLLIGFKPGFVFFWCRFSPIVFYVLIFGFIIVDFSTKSMFDTKRR
jgi:hypothetical protein